MILQLDNGHSFLSGFCTGLVFLGLSFFFGCSHHECDLLIRDATIVDGTGSAARPGDVAIKEGRIVAAGDRIRCQECRIIEAEGMYLSPGFIDVHAHLEPLPVFSDASSALQQGVTTALGGPDGSSPLKLRPYLDSLSLLPPGINVAYLIGHNAIRAEVMGLDARLPTPSELEEMKSLVIHGMKDGAFGMSTGLKYLPGAFSELDELVSLAREASALGGIYTSHLREEGLGLIKSVREAIQIAKMADIRAVLTHHKVVGYPMWGSSKETTALVDSSRKAGLDVWIDQYPYTASYTSLSILIPAWSMEGGRFDAFARRCEDPVLRDSILSGIRFNLVNDRGGNDLSRVQLARFNWKPHLEGKSLKDWALEEGMEPTIENGAELVMLAQLNRGANAIFHAMDEEDVERIMTHPMTMIASDGRLSKMGQGFPHPRAYGTFPRVLGRYVRQRGILTMEEAIRKMTSLPASLLGLADRGRIAPGMVADLVLFDPDKVSDRADFTNPHQYPVGIHFVLVNGQIAVEGGKVSEQRFGQILRGPAFVD